MVAAAIAAGAVVSAGVGAVSSSNAADKASSASTQASRVQQAQAAQTRQDLFPYNVAGQQATAAIEAGQPLFGSTDTGYINAANQFYGRQAATLDQAQGYFGQAANLANGPDRQAALAQTPGYQFTLNQGLQAEQNSAAARGLGVSGAALKGAATYATGLADQTYSNQFNKLLQLGDSTQNTATGYGQVGAGQVNLNNAFQGNVTNTFNRLNSTASLGENAAAQSGQIGAGLTNAAASNIVGAGAAQAAGDQGIGNATTGAINAGSKNYLQYQAIQQGISPDRVV